MLDFAFTELPAVVLAFAVAVFITWFSIPLVIKIASIRNLTDPPGIRKIHSVPVPTLGGVAIFLGFALGFLVFINGYMKGVSYFTAAILLLFFTGLKDDLVALDPKKRIAVEIMAVLILVYFTDIRITSFHGFLGITDVPVWLTYLTTIFIMIVITNSINLIDGIDGLAASTGIIASVCFGVWFILSGNTGYAIMTASVTGALIAFLRFNISKGKNKIFMGDTGSLLIGFIIAVLAIMFNEVNAGTSTYHGLYSAPAVSIAILIVPLFDTLRVFTIRVLKGYHPFKADNRHIHHLMLRAGYSHLRSTFVISLIHIGIIALAFSLDHIGILWLSLVLLSVSLLLTGILYIMVYRNYFYNNIPVKEEDYRMISFISVIHGRIIRKKIQIPVEFRSASPDTEVLISEPQPQVPNPKPPDRNQSIPNVLSVFSKKVKEEPK